MQTLKTAVVVVLLLVVLYGAYDILTRPTPEPPPEVAAALDDVDSLAPPSVDFDAGPVVVNPDQADTTGSPAPPLDVPNQPPAVATSNPPSDSTNAATSRNPIPGGPIEPQPPVSRFVPPAAPPAPADPRLQRNPFLHDRTAATGTGHDDHAGHSHDASHAAHTAPAETPGNTATMDAATPRAGERAYQRVRVAAEQDVAQGRYREALAKLSIFYRSPDLNGEEHEELLDWLDPLAARVIYSRESLVEEPYVTRKNDTLKQIGEQYQVPWQLLQKINGIADPDVLVPGTSLKVIRGPFRAEVRVSAGEVTLFLGELYAGRFPVSVGNDPTPQLGEYQVRDKQTSRTYYAADGRTIPAGSPSNPYGNVWIDLGNDMSIHGSPTTASAQLSGCIGLSPRDAEDLFSILSIGSTVKIRQ